MLNRRELLRRASWLTGGALAAPAMLAILQSCKQEAKASFEPTYFTPAEAAFVTAYVDTLLPKTETPGGLDVGVDRFIDKVMAAAGPRVDAPGDFGSGIRAIDEEASKLHGKAFAELDLAQRGELFAAAEQRSARYSPQVWGTAVGEQPPIDFYRSLKSMALWAYLSSETIATEVLNYDPVPGEYNGDIPLSSVNGRAWSL